MTIRRRVALTLATGLLSTGGAIAAPVVLTPARTAAEAYSTYLCTGYASCAAAGYTSYGYASKDNNSTMWWRMYAGHNCTNYVAYRLVASGLPNERPWSGSGNATNWGSAMSDITDQTPMVGAVAWWRANTPGAGSSGHVAIVEQVVSPDQIVISEDMWGGDFHWRTVTRSSGAWPAGFIHFNDRPLAPVTKPSISGDPVVGATLTADPGRWAQADAKLAVQWLAGGTPIPGATSPTLEVTPDLLDQPLKVRVTATRQGYQPGKAASPRSAAVRPGQLAVAQQPAVDGTPKVGETLTLAPASWSPAPTSVSTQWLADGVPIEGATGPTLVLDADLVGAAITVQQTADATGYTTSQLLTPGTAKVRPGTIQVATPFVVRGATRVGRTLTVVPGTVTPADAGASYTWTRDGVPIAGATGAQYTATADDVGHLVEPQVVLSRRGYTDRTLALTTPGPVTTTPVLGLRTHGVDTGRVVVHLKVTAEGVRTATGTVTAWVGQHSVTGDLVDGVVRLVITDLAPGTRRLHVAYAGTTVIEGGHVATDVVVPEPRTKGSGGH